MTDFDLGLLEIVRDAKARELVTELCREFPHLVRHDEDDDEMTIREIRPGETRA